MGCNPTFPNFDGDPIPDLGFLPDDCDACGAGNTNIDACGVCFGGNETCVGCDGVPNSGKVRRCRLTVSKHVLKLESAYGFSA